MGAGLANAEDRKQDSSRESSSAESAQWAPSRFTPSGLGAWGDSSGAGKPAGAASGMPRFLQPQVQMKCAECAREEEEEKPAAPVQKKCAHCEEEEKKKREEGGTSVQAKCEACEREGLGQNSSSGAASDGVASANRPLPHLDRIQSSFGRHDVSGARAAVGGPAAEATGRMGALAYTSGDSVAFRSEPDVNLAAHEAAHVVQQRNGAKLPGGVGRPGDEYEKQADAAASAVERGESAEALLDSDAGGNSSGSSGSSVQLRLEVSASRTFEPAIAASAGMIGGHEGAEKAAPSSGKPVSPKAGAKTGEKEKDEGSEKEGGAPKTSASNPAAQSSASGAASGAHAAPPSAGHAQPGLSSSAAANGASPAPAGSPAAAATPAPTAAPAPAPNGTAAAAPAAPGPASAPSGGASCNPACFHGLKEEPKEEDKTDKKPDDVAGGKSEEQTKEGDEPDAPEPDNCPKQQAQAGVPATGQGAATQNGGAPAPSSAAAPAAASSASGQAAAPAPASAGAPGGAGPQAAPGASAEAGKAAGAKGGAPAGAAGGAPKAEKIRTGPSPMESSVAQGEGQRDAAVASYDSSSKALDAAGSNSAELRAGVEFTPPPQGGSEQFARTAAASARATEFFSRAADGLDDAISFSSGDVPDQLGAQAETAKAEIAASAEAQKGAVSARISASRDQARGDASMARRAVIQQADSFVEQVQSGSAAAIAILTGAHAATMGQVDALETTTLNEVNQIYAQGRGQMEGLGVTIGDECTAVGEQFATTYNTFKKCTKNGFWDGDLSGRRAEAQAEAARKTAKGYHDSMVDKAKKRAREVVRDGRKQNRCQVISTASTVRQKLDEALTQLTTTIEGARAHALEQAASTRSALLAGIDTSLRAILHQLDQQEHDQRQTIDDTCYLQQVMQEQMAHSAAASMQGLVTSGAFTLHGSLLALRSQFASKSAPDPEALDQALTAASVNVDAALGSMQNGLVGGTAAAVQQLGAALDAGLSGLDRLVSVNDDVASAISTGFAASMGAIAGQDNFAPQRAGFNGMLQQATTGGIAGFQKLFGVMRDGCGKVTEDSRKSLKTAAADLEKNLRQGRQGLECQITKEADLAASHEAPAWKRIIAVLLIIIVIIIIIVVTVLTAGASLGFFAVVGIGLVMGAVTSGLITLATNLWSNQPWDKGLVKAIVIGAVAGAAGGAIGFGIGAALGKAAPLVGSLIGQTVPKVATEVASTIISTAVVDVASQFYEGGFSLKNFSWGQLGFDLALALVMHKVGKAAEARKTSLRTAQTAPRPTEAPLEPAPAEVAKAAPAEAPPAEAAPAQATTAEPKPAEVAPTPTEAPAPEAAAPKSAAEPAPPPETAKPAPAEAAPPEPAVAETKPTEAPSAEGAPTPTPDEKAVLDNTASKHGEDLTPSEVNTERQIANQTEGKPINDPPFTTETELPNGHKMKQSADGKICERCSPGCGVYDENGNLIAETEPAPTPQEKPPAAETEPPPTAEPEVDPTKPAEENAEPSVNDDEAATPKDTEQTPAETEEPAGDESAAKPSEEEPNPWETKKQQRRYKSYKRNLKRRLAKAGKPQREPLGPEEWWDQIGRKDPHSPEGGKGNEDHQTVVQELFEQAQAQYPSPEYSVFSEVPLPEGTGVVGREPDVFIVDNATGRVIKIQEAARFNKSGGLLRKSEKLKVPNYQGAYDGKGIPTEFYPVGPNQPPGGVLKK